MIGLPCSLDTLDGTAWAPLTLWAAPLPSRVLTGTGCPPEPIVLSRPAGGYRRVSRPRGDVLALRAGDEAYVVVPGSSLDKCLVQTTRSDAAVEMTSAPSRGPNRRALLTRTPLDPRREYFLS